MKKVLFLIVASLFIFSGVYGAEGLADENNNSNDQVEYSLEKAQKDIENAKKLDKKELRKLKKAEKKKLKKQKRIMQILNNMMMVGLGILILGLLLYLIVSSAPILGIIVMIIGIVLLLYAALKQFF